MTGRTSNQEWLPQTGLEIRQSTIGTRTMLREYRTEQRVGTYTHQKAIPVMGQNHTHQLQKRVNNLIPTRQRDWNKKRSTIDDGETVPLKIAATQTSVLLAEDSSATPRIHLQTKWNKHCGDVGGVMDGRRDMHIPSFIECVCIKGPVKRKIPMQFLI